MAHVAGVEPAVHQYCVRRLGGVPVAGHDIVALYQYLAGGAGQHVGAELLDDCLDPEVLLIPLTGHTRGHCGVAVQRADRWMIHCGDAYFFRSEVETPASCPIGLMAFQSLVQMNGTLRLRNQRRLRELKAQYGSRIDIFCAHDPVELARHRD